MFESNWAYVTTRDDYYFTLADAPLDSLMDSTANPKVKTTERKWIRACSLACSILGVEGRVRALGWGVRRLTSNSIIHMDLHKPNNNLVSAQLEHLWCTNEPRANIDS
jgi:hypothetical protein